jgi:phosphinothricin acetyltransferase
MTLRLAQEDDAEGILAIYAPLVRETAISFELEAPSASEMRRRIRAVLDNTPWLVAEIDGVLAGYAYAGPFRSRPAYLWTCEVTVYVAEAFRGRRIARALYASLLAALRAAGYQSAIAGIALPNPASVALHEAMGFRTVGVFAQVGFKHGRWHDVGFWQLALQRPGLVDPEPPRRLASLVETPEWKACLDTGEGVLAAGR